MSLPKIAKITHELTIPSTGKKVKYRPFLVKEEKVLILAQESGSQKEVARAIKDVIAACVQTRGFKIDELATFDIEYLFLNIRGSSVGGDVEVIVTCPDDESSEGSSPRSLIDAVTLPPTLAKKPIDLAPTRQSSTSTPDSS